MNPIPEHPYTSQLNKKLRNLKKKVRDIEALQAQEVKTEAQQEKIKQKKQIGSDIKVIEEELKAFLEYDEVHQSALKKMMRKNETAAAVITLFRAIKA